MDLDWQPLWLTLELAALTTALLLLTGFPLAAWMAGSTSRYKPVAEAFISLPLVLPPSVLGFYLLLAFSPANSLGRFLDEMFDLQLIFSFPGLVLASMIYSLPFMVQPLQAGLQAVPASLKEASYTLGRSRLATLLRVELPLIKPALLTGLVLSFAHTIGEFGLVLMIGGNIPGQTRVASIAIYNEVESLDYAAAHTYSLVLLLLSFFILLVVHLINKKLLRTP